MSGNVYRIWRCPDCSRTWVGSDVDENCSPDEMACADCNQLMTPMEVVELGAVAEHRTTVENAGRVRVDSRDELAAEAKRRADQRLWALLDIRNRTAAVQQGETS